MLIIKRIGAVAIIALGLVAMYAIDPLVALADDDKLSLMAALALVFLAAGAALWWNWAPDREQAPSPAAPLRRRPRSKNPTIAALAVIALASLAGAASQARAESAEDRAACTPSVLMLCPREALTGNRDAATQCLIANLAKASARCQAVVRAATLAGPVRPTARLAANESSAERENLAPR